jgi:hypothetical protein
VILGFIDSIPVLLYLKSAAEKIFNVPHNEPQHEIPAKELKEEPKSESDDEDSEQRHKGVGKQQRAHFVYANVPL